jgi:hypothetical protein
VAGARIVRFRNPGGDALALEDKASASVGATAMVKPAMASTALVKPAVTPKGTDNVIEVVSSASEMDDNESMESDSVESTEENALMNARKREAKIA